MPILYLDVDGVLLRHPSRQQFKTDAEFKHWWMAHKGGGPPNGVAEFLTWARANFDCRWLTAWAMSGNMGFDGISTLSDRLGIPPHLLANMDNPLPWLNNKCEGIDWEAHERGVLWFWLDDDAHRIPREVAILDGRRCRNRLITTRSDDNPDALTFARERIERFMERAVPQCSGQREHS